MQSLIISSEQQPLQNDTEFRFTCGALIIANDTDINAPEAWDITTGSSSRCNSCRR